MSKNDTEKLVSRAKELSSDDCYIRLFNEEENYKELIRNTELAEAHEKGKLEGKLEGSEEKALEIAKKCLEKNMDINTIVELTGLSFKKIASLKKET